MFFIASIQAWRGNIYKTAARPASDARHNRPLLAATERQPECGWRRKVYIFACGVYSVCNVYSVCIYKSCVYNVCTMYTSMYISLVCIINNLDDVLSCGAFIALRFDLVQLGTVLMHV